MCECNCNNDEPRISKIFIGDKQTGAMLDNPLQDWHKVDVSLDNPITHPVTFECVLKFGVEDENKKKFFDYINNPNNKRLIDSETGNIYHFVSGELMGNINDSE